MSDKYLTRSHRKYATISPGAVYETTVQTLIQNNISSLFPEYFGKIFEPYLRTPAGDVKPDLVLIRHDYKGWMLVEVEVEGHSPSGHILPQLAKLTFASSNDDVLNHFVTHFGDSHEIKNIESALTSKPEVMLVIHGSSEGFQKELGQLGVTSLDIDIHSFPPNDFILEVFDRAENFIDTGVICTRSSSIATQYVWVLPDIPGLLYDQLDQNIEIRVGETSSIWRIEQKRSNYLLRQPSDIQSLNGVTKVAVLRHRSFLSLKFLPIQMEGQFMKLKLGNSAILAYRRLPYRLWYAIAEFVDNSTDAYLRGNNRQLLDAEFSKSGEVFSVEIDFDRDNKKLRIFDNSMGMNESELESALIIGEKPGVTAGRSEFGMGMKTAAIWFADSIEIKTKKLGEDRELRVIIDIKKFVEGDDDIKLQSTPKPKDEHYTFIELSGLQRIIRGNSLEKTREFLGSIYRQDLRNNLMKLTVVAKEVTPPTSQNDDAFMVRDDGTKVLVEINNLQINDKLVSGWLGVLKPGFTGRSYAGFSLIRHGRAVRGWLDSWRPEEIFGDARNDLINQRVTGELVMDDFKASHTKDSIDWEQDDEQKLGEALLDICKQYGILLYAKKHTRGAGNEDTERAKLEAQHLFQAQLTSTKVGDAIKMLDVPTPELAKFATAVLIEAADQTTPIGIWPMDSENNGKVAKLYEIELSPNDPYYEFEVLSNQDLRVILNSAHPANSLHDDSAEARLNHYHHVALDAIAEWKCAQLNSPLEPSSIRLMKDRLFRVIGEVSADIE